MAWARACFIGDESQQPIVPQVRQSRRWIRFANSAAKAEDNLDVRMYLRVRIHGAHPDSVIFRFVDVLEAVH